MLTIRLTNSAGLSKSYSSEIISFSWSTKNVLDTHFAGALPDMQATLVLSSTDSFFSTLTRRDLGVMQNADAEDKLYMRVVDTTILKRKATVTIVFSAYFYDEPQQRGVVTIPQYATWSEFQQAQGLDFVEAHSLPQQFQCYEQKRRDIAMAAVWSYSTRRDVSLTPFVSPVATNYNAEGFGIFRAIKSASERALYADAPLYRVRARQIVDYEVQSAQPPVTHIETLRAGNYAAMPDLLSTSYSEGYAEQVYVVVGLDLSAVYQFESGYTSQQLVWSDGVVSVIPLTDKKAEVLGIFSNAYVYREVDGTTAHIVERSTGTLLQDIPNVAGVTSRGTTLLRGALQILFIGTPNVAGTTTVGIIVARTVSGTTSYSAYQTANAGYAFMDAYMTGISSFSAAYTSLGQVQFGEGSWTGARWNGFVSSTVSCSTSYGAYNVFPLFRLPNATDLRVVWYAYRNSGSDLQDVATLITTGWDASTSDPILYSGYYPLKFDVDITEYVSGLLDADMILLRGTVSAGNFVAQDWVVCSYSARVADVPPHSLNTTPKASGSYSEWSSQYAQVEADSSWFIGNVYVASYARSANSVSVLIQSGSNPFLTRTVSPSTYRRKVLSGETNVATFEFKVGPLVQTDISEWEEERGRIMLTVVGFDSLASDNDTWQEVSAQTLGVPAVGSFMQVSLPDTSSGQPDKLLVKVVSVSIEYAGLVVLRIGGIEVKE